ncbi:MULTISPECIES: hypothetical protein [Streptomyces]|uniref:hypothetical protein n=1 Tax=Streptomyces TaxID=1883 RepID=UPI00017F1194|nr:MULTISPECIES: hypothetical protein [Streptomyces]AKL71208.1 hypothetical protein M444_38280 [Streptomyces sp. Mg1]WBY24815.1 hypothetical protein PET44_34610 [Streptomyces goshikiensis]
MRSVCPCSLTPPEALFHTDEYPNLPTLLEKLADKTGKGGFYRLDSHGINGAFHLDGAFHHGCETVAALIATTSATTR